MIPLQHVYAACTDGSVTSYHFPVDLKPQSTLSVNTFNEVTQSCGDEEWELQTKLAMYFPTVSHWKKWSFGVRR